jgi:adenosylhomocysteine nucleosidase
MAMEPPSIALIVALAQERRALRRRLSSIRAWRTEDCHGLAGRLWHEPIVLIQAGIGCDSARRALLAASRRFSIRGAWSLGFAGGLAEGFRPGDLVCPGVVFKDDGQTGQAFDAASVHSVAAALSAVRMPPSDGPLLSVDAPLLTPEAKRAAHRRTGAVAVDMEAAGVAEAAERLGIPWLAIKAVVDTVDEPLPRFLSGCTTPRGDLRWRGVLWSLAVGSRRRALGRLARASRPAALALQRSLEAVLFAWSP